jgi:hypothetical protein
MNESFHRIMAMILDLGVKSERRMGEATMAVGLKGRVI